MSKQRNELDYLITLPPTEIEHRVAAAALSASRPARSAATADNRDLTDRERELTRADTEELTALRQAATCQEQIETRSAQLHRAGDDHRRAVETRSQPTLLVDAAASWQGASAAALAQGRPCGACGDARSRVTAESDLRVVAGAWDPGAPNEPRHLISLRRYPGVAADRAHRAGPGLHRADSRRPVSARPPTTPSTTPVAPVNLTALRYGRWSGGVGTRQRGRRPRRAEPHARLGRRPGPRCDGAGGGGGRRRRRWGRQRRHRARSVRHGDPDRRRATPTPTRPQLVVVGHPGGPGRADRHHPGQRRRPGQLRRCGSPGPSCTRRPRPVPGRAHGVRSGRFPGVPGPAAERVA